MTLSPSINCVFSVCDYLHQVLVISTSGLVPNHCIGAYTHTQRNGHHAVPPPTAAAATAILQYSWRSVFLREQATHNAAQAQDPGSRRWSNSHLSMQSSIPRLSRSSSHKRWPPRHSGKYTINSFSPLLSAGVLMMDLMISRE